MKGKITIVGLGPGSPEDVTSAATEALKSADVIVGYKYYFLFIKMLLRTDAQCVDTGMRGETERAEEALCLAEEGKNVCVISSGDAGIYGMAPLIYEMKDRRNSDVCVECLPGISAFQKAAALLGAPIGHDFCCISLSDLLTPWSTIERRIKAAAVGDFVTAIYNPKSHERYWQLERLREIFLSEGRAENTPVGIVRQAGREGQSVTVSTLSEMETAEIDMFTVVIIGNSQTYFNGKNIITPRGYYAEKETSDAKNVGQEIMMRSFKTIEASLKNSNIDSARKWPLLHAIHTTADFEMEQLLKTSENAVPQIFNALNLGKTNTIITDVTMVASGIRKGALKRLGLQTLCYLDDPRTAQMAENEHITRTQAGIRLAVQEHPDALFAFGNAPTALIELCDLIRKEKAHPTGIIAAPVGFVHVEEAKHRVKTFKNIPHIIIDGKKGGSALAATLVNSILCWPDAEQLKPGRDV